MRFDRRIALLRGINVGKAKRIAMADLRSWVEALGYTDVRTLLNSGNLVYSARGGSPADDAARIEQAIALRAGFRSRVTALGADELEAVVADNPLEVPEPARFLVGVLADPADAGLLAPLADRDWAPDALAVRGRAAYQRIASGMLDSPLAAAVAKALGDGVTARNWSTVLRLRALASG